MSARGEADVALGEAWLHGLHALELASERVQTAYLSGDALSIAVEAHFGLHALYDLHEVLFTSLRLVAMADQDRFLAQQNGAVVGALAAARGAHTHRLVVFAHPAGFGQLGFGEGPFGDGWIWNDHAFESSKLRTRARWYQDHARYRLLHQPLDEAWKWFAERPPEAGFARLRL